MYKVVVNVSGKRARIVPESHKLATVERDFGDISQEDALANRDSLTEGVRGLLADKGITDSERYTIELPDDLTPRGVRENVAPEAETDSKKASKAKGPVTKPKNPKEGEPGSDTNKPEPAVEQETPPVVTEKPQET